MQPVGIWDHYLVYDEKAGNDEFYLVHLYDLRTGTDLTIATGNVRSYGCIGGEANNGKVALVFGDVYRIALLRHKQRSSRANSRREQPALQEPWHRWQTPDVRK